MPSAFFPLRSSCATGPDRFVLRPESFPCLLALFQQGSWNHSSNMRDMKAPELDSIHQLRAATRLAPCLPTPTFTKRVHVRAPGPAAGAATGTIDGQCSRTANTRKTNETSTAISVTGKKV